MAAPPIRRPATDEVTSPYAVAPAPSMSDTQETVSFSASKQAFGLVMALLLGGGGLTLAANAPNKADLIEVVGRVTAVATVAKTYTDEKAQQMRDERRTEMSSQAALLAAQLSAMTSQLSRLDSKMDQLTIDVGTLKIEVATIKARTPDARPR